MTHVNQEAQDQRRVLHYLMQLAFVDIRAASSPDFAKKLADIFHNLPMRLLRCHTADDYEAERRVLFERAKRWGFDGYLEEWIVLANNSAADR